MFRCLLISCLLLLVPAVSAQIVPMTNDDCTSAITVTDGINPGPSGNFFTNAGATAGFPFPICMSGTNFDVWFAYTATATNTIIVSTCVPPGFVAGTMNDSVLSVLDGSSCPPTVLLGCDDDSCAFMSSVSAPVTVGGLYFFRVSGLFGSTGTFYLTVSQSIVTVPNDDCTSPIALAVGQNGPYQNASATNSAAAASCAGLSPGFRDVWFSYAPVCSGPVTIDTGCNAFDTILTAYNSCGGPEIACNDDSTGCGLSSSITFQGTAGAQYRIRVAAFDPTSTGTFVVNVTPGAGMTLAFSSPFGPGSIRIDIADGPSFGTYFLGLTFFAGAYPNGWLFGVDLPLPELTNLLNIGSPFVGTLGLCGQLTIGPFGGVGFLSGIPMYAVALGIPTASPIPTFNSSAVTYTIP